MAGNESDLLKQATQAMMARYDGKPPQHPLRYPADGIYEHKLRFAYVIAMLQLQDCHSTSLFCAHRRWWLVWKLASMLGCVSHMLQVKVDEGQAYRSGNRSSGD
jgi:hypothetical protein